MDWRLIFEQSPVNGGFTPATSSSRESSGREPIRGFNIDLPTFEPNSKKNCWKSRILLRKIAETSTASNNPKFHP